MICLDFCGLPGSGKSTISHMLAERLRHRAEVAEPSYYMDHHHSTIARWLLKYYGCLYLFLLNPSHFISLIRIIRDCGHNLYQKAFYINLLNLAYKIVAINRSDADYLILDQGIWQAVVSLYYRDRNEHNYESTYNRLKELVRPDSHFLNIYVNVETLTAVLRIMERHACVSRVQKLSYEDLFAELEWQKHLFVKLPCHSVIVDSNHSVDGCVKQILDIIGSN